MSGSERDRRRGTVLAVVALAIVALAGATGVATAGAASADVASVHSASGDTASANPATATFASAEADVENDCPGGMAGSGTAQDPCIVETVEHLQAIGEDHSTLDDHYVLGNDIDGGGETIEPIGDEEDWFTGTFDGQGHAITDLTVDGTDGAPAGLFAVISGRVEALVVQEVAVQGGETAGLLAGVNEGDVMNVHLHGSVSDTENPPGGAVGANVGLLDRVHADVAIDGQGAGMAESGAEEASFVESFATGDIEGEQAAGFVANDDGAIYDASYWDRDGTGQDGSGGDATGLGTGEMQGPEWDLEMALDFNENWVSVIGDYPVQTALLESLDLTVEESALEVGETTVTLEVDHVTDERSPLPALRYTNEEEYDEFTIDDEGVLTAEAPGEVSLVAEVEGGDVDGDAVEVTITDPEEDDDDGDGDGGDNGAPPPPPDEEGELSLIEATIANETLTVGAEIVLEAEIEADGDCESCVVDLAVEGATKDESSVTLGDGDTATLHLSAEAGEPGTLEVAVLGEAVGSVEVQAAEDDDADGATDETDDAPDADDADDEPPADDGVGDTDDASDERPHPDDEPTGPEGDPVASLVATLLAAVVGLGVAAYSVLL